MPPPSAIKMTTSSCQECMPEQQTQDGRRAGEHQAFQQHQRKNATPARTECAHDRNIVLARVHGLKQGDEDAKTGSNDQQKRKAPDDVGPKPENCEEPRRFVGRRRGLE